MLYWRTFEGVDEFSKTLQVCCWLEKPGFRVAVLYILYLYFPLLLGMVSKSKIEKKKCAVITTLNSKHYILPFVSDQNIVCSWIKRPVQFEYILHFYYFLRHSVRFKFTSHFPNTNKTFILKKEIVTLKTSQLASHKRPQLLLFRREGGREGGREEEPVSEKCSSFSIKGAIWKMF